MPKRKEIKESKEDTAPIDTEELYDDYDGWKYIFYAGTDLKSFHSVTRGAWNFNKFSDDMEDDGAIIDKVNKGYQCFVFGGVEPTSLTRRDGKTFKIHGKKTSETVVPVPYLTAVFTKNPLPDVYAVTSVQMEGDISLHPMQSLNLAWANFVGAGAEPILSLKKSKLRPIFYLDFSMRSSVERKLDDDKRAVYEYGNPFVIRPKLVKLDIEDTRESFESSNIIELPDQTIAGIEVDLSMDLAVDKPGSFISSLIEKYSLPDTDETKQEIKDTLAPHIAKRREENAKAIAFRENLLTSLTEQNAIDNDEMIIHKYYPVHLNDLYDITPALNKRINRFFGDADVVYHHETEVCKEDRAVTGIFASFKSIE